MTKEIASFHLDVDASASSKPAVKFDAAAFNKMYAPKPTKKKGRPKKKPRKKSRKKSAEVFAAQRDYAAIRQGKGKAPPHKLIWRINCGSIIYLFRSRKEAKAKSLHLSRKYVQIKSRGGYYIRMRDGIQVRMYGIRPKDVQVEPSGDILVNLEKSEDYIRPMTYSKEILAALADRVKGSNAATLKHLGKDTDSLAHVLSCIGVKHTEEELSKLASLMQSTFADVDWKQTIRISRRQLWFARRTKKSEKLLGPATIGVTRPIYQKHSSRLLGDNLKVR